MPSETRTSDATRVFERDGFLLLRSYLGAAEVDDINRELERYIAEVLLELPASESLFEAKDDPGSLMRLGQMHKHDGFFNQYMHDQRLTETAAGLLDEKVVPMGVQLFDKPPLLGKITPPHQDGFYFMLEPNEAITLWVTLDPADVGNGCMRFVPGSCWQGIRPHRRSNILGFSQGITDFGDADRDTEQAVETQPGDVLAHHSMTIHRTGPNSSDRRRRALGLVYYARRARVDKEKAAAYQEKLYKEWESEGRI